MTREHKKEKERMYAISTAKALGECWAIEDIPEPLDFIIRLTNNEFFGLEVVELYDSPRRQGGAALKQVVGIQQRYLREIVSGYYRRTRKPVRVNFLGCLDRVDEIIEALVFASHSLSEEEIRLDIGTLQAWIRPLPENDARFVNYGRWQTANAGFVRLISDDLVLQQIKLKSEKLELYTAKAEVVDLLLVIDRTTNAGRFTISDSFSCANTGFRRVILLNYPLDAVILSPARD